MTSNDTTSTMTNEERVTQANQMAYDAGVVYGKWRARYGERAAQFGEKHPYTLAVKKMLFAAAREKSFTIENAYRVERAYRLNQ